MIGKKVDDIVAQAIRALGDLEAQVSSNAVRVIADARAQVEALVALGKDFPTSLESILDRCAGGRSFIVRDLNVIGDISTIDFEVYLSRGCGCGRQMVYTDNGILLPGPKDAPKDVHGNELPHKVRVVIMLMPVVEEEKKS
jgi:hypothetical protein